MKIFGFIPVRVNSVRLLRKTLMVLNGKRVIDHVIERAKLIRSLDGIVICTSVEPEDDILEEIAMSHNVSFFRGSLEDKLDRFESAALRVHADYIIILDADDLFCDQELNELAIAQIKSMPCDIVKSPDGLVAGAFDFCISVSALREVCAMKDTTKTEMYETYFLMPGRFKVCDLNIRDKIFFNETIRLTLDYQEDFNFFEKVFSELKMDTNIMSLREILSFINDNLEIAKINFFRHVDYLSKREIMKLNTKIKN